MTVADNTSRNQYTATSGQTVFAYTFEIVDKDDIVVLKNGTTLSEGTDYSVSGVGTDSGGNVTLTVGASTNDVLTLYRDMPYARTQNYTNSGDFLASDVNSDFDNLWLAGEQTNRAFEQSVRKPITDSDSISMELPEAADRANKVLGFDENGAPSTTLITTDAQTIAGIAADIATLADIEDGTVATDAITNVNAVRTDVTTVSGISTDVTTVSGNTTNINTVATDLSGDDDIGTVAGSIANVNATGSNISNVNSVAGNATNINTVATDLAGSDDIGTVAGAIANVNATGSNIADVNTVATDLTGDDDIGTVATNIANVNATGSNINNVNTVAGIASDVTSVAGDATDIGTVATNITNVNNVGSNINNVNTVANNNSNITDVADDLNGANTIGASLTNAGNAANSATAAANSATDAQASADSASSIISGLVNLDSAVSSASSSASSAATSATEAEGYRDEAESHKDNAYTYSQSAASAVAYQDLAAISQSKSETAIRTFVYDTTKDSDGGAWRDQTQHTSWYNETLNTTTRGATKKFPAVAVLVLEQDQLTIYDGDDPSMPMWMVFNNGYNNMVALGSGYYYTTVAMLNGELVVGHNDGARSGLDRVYFIKDEGIHYGSNNTNAAHGSAKYKGTIEQRNDALSNVLAGLPTVISNRVNDVAMTVLPDAPIDDATGLPIPTLAVAMGVHAASNGGTSIIHDDGSVVDIVATGAAGGYAHYGVDFGPNNELVIMQGYNKSYMTTHVFDELPTSDIAANDTYAGARNYKYNHRNPSVLGDFGSGPSWRTMCFADDVIANGSDARLSLLHENKDDQTKSMVCQIETDFTSGWQVGDSELVAMASTNTANLSGGNIAQNGDFATGDLTGFEVVLGSGTYSVSNNQLVIAHSSGNNQLAIKPNGANLPVGDYLVEVQKISAADWPPLYVNSMGGYAKNHAIGDKRYYQVTQKSVSDVKFVVTGSGADGTFDNIKVHKIDPDRSVEARGLIAEGNLTRTAVATGAELVSYGNFTNSNVKLEQKENTNLDFGTGDFCMMVWAKDHGLYDTFLTRTDGVTQATELIWQTANTADSYRLYVAGHTIHALGLGFPTEGWHLHTVVRRSGSIYLYHDGELQYTTSSAGAGTLTQSGAKLRIGSAVDVVTSIGADRFEGEMALLRITKSVPTEAQLKKIYEDEKHLFKENAKCTLFGTDDQVRVAYDKDTDLLHAGTASGRSVFKQLQRVDNTTDAVGICISASNNLVVEE